MPAILKGQRLNAARTYEPIPFTAKPDGTLCGESKVLSLHLCLDEGRLRLFDPVTNEFLATNEEKDDLLAKERKLSAQQAREIEELKRRLAAR